MKENLINRDISLTAINQIWKLASGLLLLVFIPIYLSPEEQGYWYTFISLAALVYFADMGFSTLALQFAAHEYAHLNYLNKKLTGEDLNLRRLASLWVFTKKYSRRISLIVMPIVCIYGYIVLHKQNSVVSWLIPWFIYAAASSIIFINGMILSFTEGCDNVASIQRIRLETSIITVSLMIALLYLNAGLLALPIATLVGAFSCSFILMLRYNEFYKQLNDRSKLAEYKWWSEINPLIGRYAISWMCGYFIYSIFTPIAFIYFSSTEAGKIGLSIMISTAIFGVSNIWITSITPKLNMLVAKRNYQELNKIFHRSLILAVITYACGVTLVVLTLALFEDLIPFRNRIISLTSFILLSFCWLLQIFVNAWALYVRAHKKEPLMYFSIFIAIYTGLATLICAKYLPENYYFSGFLSGYILGLPWVFFIFKNFRN